jgi:hypothetical protein
MALASFSAHLPPGRIRELLAACACEPLQLYRTIGEMQIGVGGDPRKVFAADADRALGNDLAQGLAFSLDPAKGPPMPDDQSPLEREREARARAAREAVMREAQAGRPLFTGVLLRASADGLRTLSRSADVLAIEIAYGSGRNFPVTIDLLEAGR